MICCASHSDDMIMTTEDIERAIALLTEVEVKMGTVFKGMGRSEMSGLLNDAIVYITNSHLKEIPFWQFAKYFEGDMDKVEMERVLTTLEAMRAIKIIKKPGAEVSILVLDETVK